MINNSSSLFPLVQFRFWLILLLVASSSTVIGQTEADDNQKKFDSIYFETAVNIAAQDIDRAIQISDSLYQNSTVELHKLKSLMLSASLFHRKGEMKKCMRLAKRAYKIAVDSESYDWQARILGFLSTQYRNVGLYKQGEVYLQKGKEVGKLVENKQNRIVYLGLTYQESAYYELEYKKFKKAYKAVEVSQSYFSQIKNEQNRNYFIANNEELFGRVCLKLERWDEAITHLNKSIELLSKVTEETAMLTGLVRSGLGRAYLEKGENDLAYENLEKAKQIVIQSNDLDLKIEVYKTLSEYYKIEEDYDQFLKYHDEYLSAFQLGDKKHKELIDEFFDETKEETEKKVNKASYNQRLLFTALVILVLIIFIIIILFRRSKRREVHRFNVIIDKIRNQEKIAQESVSAKLNTESKENKKSLVSDAVESKILRGLDEFESTNKFTDNQMSLPVLAGILNTNTKYLSYVLNTRKNKDFSSYINELRINYIIDKIEKNDVFKNYKISYLAQESGFSSHSKFSAVFKSVTGLSPSTFLDLLKKSQ